MKTVKEIFESKKVVKELMNISEELNDEVMIETDSYYNGGIFEDGDLEEVLMELNINILDFDFKVSNTVQELIEEQLNFVQEEIKIALMYNKKENLYIHVPYCNIENRFDEDYPQESIYFFDYSIIA
nr:MAG TPA: hypothetical protein [Caudoviricetes sp.]